jgi:hypothetical protein
MYAGWIGRLLAEEAALLLLAALALFDAVTAGVPVVVSDMMCSAILAGLFHTRVIYGFDANEQLRSLSMPTQHHDGNPQAVPPTARPRSRKQRGISQPGSGRSGEALRAEEHGNNQGFVNGINLKAQRQYYGLIINVIPLIRDYFPFSGKNKF